GDREDQAYALNELGVLHRLTGNHRAAAASHRQALELFREFGARLGQAEALNNLRALLSQTPHTQQTPDDHAQAPATPRKLGASHEEARALEGIGHSQLQDGHISEGTAHLEQALAIYQRIKSPSAQRVQETVRQYALKPASPPSSEDNRRHAPSHPKEALYEGSSAESAAE